MWYTANYDMSNGQSWPEDRVASTLAAYLRREIKGLGLNPSSFARKAEIPITTLNYILNTPTAKPTPAVLEKIAVGLGVEPAELTSKIGYTVDNVKNPDGKTVRLARAIVDRPWIAARQDLLLSLSAEEFDELMDEVEFRRRRRRDRQDQD